MNEPETKREPSINDARVKLHQIQSKTNRLQRIIDVLHKNIDEDINWVENEQGEKLVQKDTPKPNLRFEMNTTASETLDILDKTIEAAIHLKAKLVTQ